MIGGVQHKILVTEVGGEFVLDEEFAELTTKPPIMKYELVRERDSLTKSSAEVGWIEWDAGGVFKEKHESIKVGYSLIMSPFNRQYTWQTTIVTEVVEVTEERIRFKTENSEYLLYSI
jgi:hypothetical protein